MRVIERQATLDTVRAQIAALERPGARGLRGRSVLFGLRPLDGHLPGTGLALGALHEVAGAGLDAEHAAAAALFTAGILARMSGPVLWAQGRRDLFGPALAGVGLHPDRVIYAETRDPRTVLLTMEDALRHPGLAGVVGELRGRLGLTASRRLQLAAEASGVTAFVIRRTRRHDDPTLAEPSAAVTRWRVAALPSGPPRRRGTTGREVAGLGRPRWRLDLVRCRGGEAASWTVEACDAQGRLDLVADLAHRPAAPARRRAAG